jgi:hypothetical protein
VKHWYTWISNTTSITGEALIYMYMNIKHYKYKMLHQSYWQCLIFMYINVSPVILVVFDIHVYQCFTSYTSSVWYSCISIFHQLYLYMNIKHYKYNWWIIDIHEYQTLPVWLGKHWYTWISNTTSITGETLIYYISFSPVKPVVFDIHLYQCFSSYTCSVWYSCISMFHQLYLMVKHWYTWISNSTNISGEILIYMNIKHYKYNWRNIDIHEYQTLQV